MKEKTITLPVDLNARMSILKAEIGVVLEAQIRESLNDYLKSDHIVEALTQKGYGKIATIEFDTCQEYNDEGGTDTCFEYINLIDDNGETIDDEVCYQEKSRYSDNYYEVDLNESVRDFFYDFNIDEIVEYIGCEIDLLVEEEE